MEECVLSLDSCKYKLSLIILTVAMENNQSTRNLKETNMTQMGSAKTLVHLKFIKKEKQVVDSFEQKCCKF